MTIYYRLTQLVTKYPKLRLWLIDTAARDRWTRAVMG